MCYTKIRTTFNKGEDTMNQEQTKAVLNQLVADLVQFSTVIHQTHWYMRGPGFLTLHPRMDEYMEEIDGQLDEVAERLITIGGAPFSTLKEFSENTKIPDTTGTFDKTMAEHLENLVTGFRYLRDLYSTGIKTAGSEDDQVTEDMLIEFKGAVEKNIWMLQAELNKAPNL